MGPIIIFDKSFLQSLNVDESVWLENFFLTNLTPIFYIETLVDLEKKVTGNRTPQQIVGNIALKTPQDSYPNVHHFRLLVHNLLGGKVDMSNRLFYTFQLSTLRCWLQDLGKPNIEI